MSLRYCHIQRRVLEIYNTLKCSFPLSSVIRGLDSEVSAVIALLLFFLLLLGENAAVQNARRSDNESTRREFLRAPRKEGALMRYYYEGFKEKKQGTL